MEFGIVSVPAAPVRKKPAHSREMINQLLFGELVEILAVKSLWAKVRSLHDLYEGWVTRSMLLSVDEKAAGAKNEFTSANAFDKLSLAGSSLLISAGSSLPAFDSGKGKLGPAEYEFTGKVIKIEDQVPSSSLVSELSAVWLNAPYLWGGRTVLGTDCSGFVQVIYKMMGIFLPRDASQQAMEGRRVQKFRDRLPGDLAFFKSNGSITHVGIVLADEKIIHSSGKVRIDQLGKKGIIDAETGKRMQKLECIRRFW